MRSNSIILFGLNDSASYEAKMLRKKGNKVYFIGKGSKADQITIHKTKYNLNKKPELDSFVATLNLPPARATNLTVFLSSADLSNIKDELAEFALVLSEIEKKNEAGIRLIISGHSVGGTFWGDDNGMISVKRIKDFAKIFPKASLLIEDLHLAACYSGNRSNLKEWHEVFQSLSTIWAYSDSAPGSYSGAIIHMTRWDGATRGSKINLDRSIADRSRKGQNVVVWSKQFGYSEKLSTTVADLLSRLRRSESVFNTHFSGETVVYDTQSGPLRNYYSDLQLLVGHELVTAEQKIKYKPKVDVTIRLIYFKKKIRSTFSKHYSSELSSAYAELSMLVPAFENLSRKECVKAVDKFLSEVNTKKLASPSISQAKKILVDGLKNLEDNKIIPLNWI